MSQQALKNIRRYLRSINAENQYKTYKRNYKNLNWKERTVINEHIKKAL